MRAFTLQERPELEGAVRSMSPGVLPEFMHHDAGANCHWDNLFTDFAGFQVAVCDGDQIFAAGNSMPLFLGVSLDGLPGGVGDTVGRGVRDRAAGYAPTVASALLAIVDPGYQGRGLSTVVLRTTKDVAPGSGLRP